MSEGVNVMSCRVQRLRGVSRGVGLVVAACVAVEGCAGTGDTSVAPTTTTSSTTTADYAQTCSRACAAVESCLGGLSGTDCETQCAVELAGQGYLIPEAATDYFGYLADAGSDADCAGTMLTRYYDPLDGSPSPIEVLEPAVLAECVDDGLECEPNTYPGLAREACYFTFYRWNAERRESIRECWAAPCSGLEYTRGDCVCEKQPGGMPYLGQGPPEPDPSACPWKVQ